MRALKPPLTAIPPEVVALADYEPLAQERMEAGAWAFLNGGAGDELTLRDNRAAFDRLRLQGRVLADLAGGHTRLNLFGAALGFPVLLAPVALQKLAHPEGELASAVAALALGSGLVLSTEASVALEDVAALARGAGAATSSLWFQLYVQHDRDFTLDLVRRAETAGYGALVLTVDAPVNGVRDRQRRAQYRPPPGMEPVNLRGLPAPPPHQAPAGAPVLFGSPLLERAAGWADLRRLRQATRLPLLLKGVLAPADARRALDEGVDGLIVSNHGGRTLDGLPAAVDALPAVAAAVQGRVPLLLDGGVRRGTDVLKALALGASAVLLGRPYVHALAAAGSVGVAHALHLLRGEFEAAMVFTGCRTLADIGPGVLWPAPGGEGARQRP